jgi:hypothetical protein
METEAAAAEMLEDLGHSVLAGERLTGGVVANSHSAPP